ncbi:11766_t:CDS:2, partial [Scutellospora calospora]
SNKNSDQDKNERIDEEQGLDEYKIRKIRGIPKSTYYRKFGASGTLTSAAKGTSKITSFLGPSTSTSPTYLALRLASPTYLTLAKLNSDENESED